MGGFSMRQPKKRNTATQNMQSRRNLISIATPGEQPVSIADAADFIARRIQPHGQKIGDVIDKVRKVVRYAIEHGKLEAATDKSIVFAELAAWTKTKKRWLGKFDDLPSHAVGEVNMSLPSLKLVAYGTTVPNALEECHALIIKLSTDNFKLAQENHALKSRLDGLEPARKAYDKIRADGSVNGKNGGRGNEK
jgi:DNA-directed RNA polymerase subunit F